MTHAYIHSLKHTHPYTSFELQILQWVVVLLNCLCIVFPCILELMDSGLGFASTFALIILPSPTPAESGTDLVLTLPYEHTRSPCLCLLT